MKLTIHLDLVRSLSFRSSYIYISSCLSVEITFSWDPIEASKLKVTAAWQHSMKHAVCSIMCRDCKGVKVCSEEGIINVGLTCMFFKVFRI
jgi:hypothetical protein